MGASETGHKKPPMTASILERLARYYQCVRGINDADTITITSAKIAESVEVDDTQVRKDLGGIGLRGVPRVGFERSDVIRALREALSLDEAHRAIIIGTGRLGGAIANYAGFSDLGLTISALFDADSRIVGSHVGSCVVRPIEQMESFIKERNIRLAILTLPAEHAQETADKAIDAGVQAIWNFTPGRLRVPEGIIVRHEFLAVGLCILTHHLGMK